MAHGSSGTLQAARRACLAPGTPGREIVGGRWRGEGLEVVEGVPTQRGYLGERGGLEKRAELRGDWKLLACEGEVGDSLRGLPRSPLWSFHSSSSFSMDRRLFTLDSFFRDWCSTACSVDSCLQGEAEQRFRRRRRDTDVGQDCGVGWEESGEGVCGSDLLSPMSTVYL